MAKSFKKAAARPSVYESISGTQSAENTQSTPETPTTKKQEYYRFNLKMPIEYKEYLQAVAYKASSPAKVVTITEYICDLIKADIEKNGQ